MTSRTARRRLLCATVLSGACLLAGPAAMAQPPSQVDPGVRVVDSAHVLGDTSGLQTKIDDVAEKHNITLYVVYVDRFTDPGNPGEWVQEFARTNGLGSNDAVLAVATSSQQVRFTASPKGPLSRADQQKIYDDHIAPALRQKDWGATAQGAVDGINDELSGGLGGAGGAVTGVVLVGGLAAVGVGGAAVLRKRRRRGQDSQAQGEPRGERAPERPLVPLPELHKRAGSALVEADNAIQHSEQELAFAQLQYGSDQTRPFEEALARAKEHMRASFELQQKLEDDIPDSEADQRAWLGEIIERTRQARTPLAEQEKSFSQLRQLEGRAPEALDAVRRAVADTRPRLQDAESLLVSLHSQYDDAALAPVRDNGQQARERLEFADSATARAEQELAAGRTSEAVLNIRAAEEAQGQAQGLIASVENARRELARAEESLKDAVSIAQRDVAEAEGLVRQGTRPELAGAASGVRSVLHTVTQQMASGHYDPIGSTRRLAQAKAELDKGLQDVRNANDRARSARETLSHALVSAQASLTTASDYVWARRGGVGAQARTELAEAERHLELAGQLQNSDPERALNEANQSIRLADAAQRSAQNDVDQFYSSPMGYGGMGYGPSRSNGLGGAMLGGILLGGILNGGGGFGGGHYGGGDFGGGFGGGDFGGGDFGGFDDGVGGNF
ncbi:TPM domain-containing protein [Kocuria tytonis]|uniref:TPM domain-containing protein n=1 Tax=Kocuria tytonis TaxID=2054280 RepID=A0A495A9H8_9MICC|nr:TPM domain-containing protein [Kocuria tytonis]RKQ36721.1 TPM domain-containing protein [Kocuria tytonis]